ncbi:MAG: hypothetical protein EOO13_09915 [Chitinophagaceae bacterium]|nr:MAG: hypothetical protein EOO13_09915 [Chitinophagaceae bacterium]
MQLFACSNKSNEMTSGGFNTVIADSIKISVTDSMKLKLTVGTKTFTVTLYSNPTVSAFKSRLPMTVNMRDLNNNEKFFDLPEKLPVNGSNPGTIQTGDLMLYGSNTLVLFYKSFATSYSYTLMGRIDDVNGFAAALGSGTVSVTFALSQ